MRIDVAFAEQLLISLNIGTIFEVLKFIDHPTSKADEQLAAEREKKKAICEKKQYYQQHLDMQAENVEDINIEELECDSKRIISSMRIIAKMPLMQIIVPENPTVQTSQYLQFNMALGCCINMSSQGYQQVKESHLSKYKMNEQMLIQPQLSDCGIKIVNQNNYINILKPVAITAQYKTTTDSHLRVGKLTHIQQRANADIKVYFANYLDMKLSTQTIIFIKSVFSQIQSQMASDEKKEEVAEEKFTQLSKVLLDDEAIEKIERQAKKIKYRKIYPAYKVVKQLKVGLDKIDLV